MALIDYMNKNISCLVSATLQAQQGLLANDIEVTSLEVDGYLENQTGNLISLHSTNPAKPSMILNVRC